MLKLCSSKKSSAKVIHFARLTGLVCFRKSYGIFSSEHSIESLGKKRMFPSLKSTKEKIEGSSCFQLSGCAENNRLLVVFLIASKNERSTGRKRHLRKSCQWKQSREVTKFLQVSFRKQNSAD